MNLVGGDKTKIKDLKNSIRMSIRKNKKDINEDFINDLFNEIGVNSCSFKIDLTKNIKRAQKKMNIN